MLNVNAFLANALAAGGIDLPASEDPLRDPVKTGAYITWQQGQVETERASGVPYLRRYPATVCLWVLDDSVDWQRIRNDMADAFDAYRPQGNGVTAVAFDLTGARAVDSFNGRVVTMKVKVTERLWVLENQREESGQRTGDASADAGGREGIDPGSSEGDR